MHVHEKQVKLVNVVFDTLATLPQPKYLGRIFLDAVDLSMLKYNKQKGPFSCQYFVSRHIFH